MRTDASAQRSDWRSRAFGTSRGRTAVCRLLLSMPLALSLSFGACQTVPTTPPSIACPQPNTIEIDDYAVIVEGDPDRPAVRWVGRVIGYCWPERSDAWRRGELSGR